jgi:3-oxoacyl-[acyl-carrier protein] reductase
VDIEPLDQVAADVSAAGTKFLAVDCDVRSETETAELPARIAGALEPATILVNNAGIYPSVPFAETSYALWREVQSLNVDGAFLVTKALVPQMVAAGWGRIVNVVSAVVFLAPPKMVAYTTSKSALVGFTRALATDLGPTGVTVNALAPGLTRTATALSSAVAADFPRVVESQAVPRAEEADDLVSTLLYMCDEGSAFLTGQTVNVDGGFAKH